MVYNANSIWMRLYVAHILRYRDNSIPAELPIRDAFTRSTDGPDCPIANCYTVEEFSSIAAASGLKTRLIGAACALSEIQLAREELQNALANPKLEAPHREFLQGLTFDGETPLHNGVPAGIDLILEMTV